MTKIHELNNLLSELEIQGGYFIDFISRSGIQAGIIRLYAGENDTQGPHPVAEPRLKSCSKYLSKSLDSLYAMFGRCECQDMRCFPKSTKSITKSWLQDAGACSPRLVLKKPCGYLSSNALFRFNTLLSLLRRSLGLTAV
jgi:hypothetical protein